MRMCSSKVSPESRCHEGHGAQESRGDPSSHADVSAKTFVSSHFRLRKEELESYLKRYGLNYKLDAGKDAVHVEVCPFCHDTKGLAENHYKLCIWLQRGKFMCLRCNAKGLWFDFKRRLGFDDDFVTSFQHPSKSRSLSASHGETNLKLPKQGSQDAFVNNLWNKEGNRTCDAKNFLNGTRGLKDNVLRKYGIGASMFSFLNGNEWKQERCITFPMFDANGNLVRHKVRSIHRKSGMRLEPKGGGWGFFGLQTVPEDAKEIVITEGEFDAMSVHQSTGRPAISLPNGASSLPVQLIPLLERFEQIYLWMDEDEPGKAGAEQFCRKLGLHRCSSVSGITAEGKICKDANDGLKAGLDLNGLILASGPIPHSGLLRFSDFRDEVFSELNGLDTADKVKSQSLPRLNELIKGHRPGELTIFTGPTGVGKTTMLSQLSLDYCMQGVGTLWGSLEIPNKRLALKMLTQFHAAYKGGSSLGKEFNYWADRFAELPMHFMKYHGSNPAERIIDAMEYANYAYDCRHVLLDNLQFMTYGQGNQAGYGRSQFEVMDHAVAMLREFCSMNNSHVSLVVHPRKENDGEKIQLASVFGSGKSTQEADNVIILQRGADCVQLEVKKNRFDGSLGAVDLVFNSKTLLYRERDSAGGWALRGDGARNGTLRGDGMQKAQSDSSPKRRWDAKKARGKGRNESGGSQKQLRNKKGYGYEAYPPEMLKTQKYMASPGLERSGAYAVEKVLGKGPVQRDEVVGDDDMYQGVEELPGERGEVAGDEEVYKELLGGGDTRNRKANQWQKG